MTPGVNGRLPRALSDTLSERSSSDLVATYQDKIIILIRTSQKPYDLVCTYDLRNATWNSIVCSGDAPVGHEWNRIVVVSRYLMLFCNEYDEEVRERYSSTQNNVLGGESARCGCYCLDLSTFNWTFTPWAPNARHPKSRKHYSLAVVGLEVFLYGGIPALPTSDPHSWKSGYQFLEDCSNGHFDMYTYSPLNATLRAVTPSSALPPRLFSHSCCAYGTDWLVCFGGMILADPQTDVQRFLYSPSAAPPCALPNASVFLYHIPTSVWSSRDRHVRGLYLHQDSEEPEPRISHAAHIYHDEMYMYGGYVAGIGWVNDLWAFHIPSGRWRKIIVWAWDHVEHIIPVHVPCLNGECVFTVTVSRRTAQKKNNSHIVTALYHLPTARWIQEPMVRSLQGGDVRQIHHFDQSPRKSMNKKKEEKGQHCVRVSESHHEEQEEESWISNELKRTMNDVYLLHINLNKFVALRSKNEKHITELLSHISQSNDNSVCV